jgi:hypothetical protein
MPFDRHNSSNGRITRRTSSSSSDNDAQRRGWMKWECSLIGSAEGLSLRLSSALVEPLHAAVLRTSDGGYELWDLNTRTGTYLNGIRIVRAGLHDGDQIRIGPFALRFVGGGTGSGKIIPPSRRRIVEHQVPAVAGAAADRPAPVKPQPKLTAYSIRSTADRLRAVPKHDPGSGLANNLAAVHAAYPLTGNSSVPAARNADEQAVQAEMSRLRQQVTAQRRLLEEAARRLREQEARMMSQSTHFAKLEHQLGVLSQTQWTPAVGTGSGELSTKLQTVRPSGIPVVPGSAPTPERERK